MVFRIYVGSYTNEIYTLNFDPESSSLTLESSITVGFHPSWITPHPKDRSVVFTGLEESKGQVVVVRFDENGKGSIIGSASSGGRDPCSLLATDTQLLIGNVRVFSLIDDPKRILTTGNQYSSGIFNTIPLTLEAPYLAAPGAVALQLTGTGPNADRQESSHPHQVILHPQRDELLVPDLGADKTWRFKKNAQGTWEIAGHVSYKPGDGPRHLAFHSTSLSFPVHGFDLG